MSIKNLRNQSGFTLIELLIVIVIIGILAAFAIATFGGATDQARDAQRQGDIRTLQSSLETYYANNGYYPDGLDDLPNVDPEALLDPDGSTYTYTATAAGGGACTTAAGDCTDFVVTATLSDAIDFTKEDTTNQ